MIKRIKWKAHLYENSRLNTSNPLNYIFKIRRCSPQHKDIQFEINLLEAIKSAKFKKVKSKFLDQLNKDISSIKKSQKNVFIFADKTC